MSPHSSLFMTTFLAVSLLPGFLLAETRSVSSVAELRAAIGAANPGDRIVLADGTYRLDAKIDIRRPGTPQDPIVVEAANRHGAIIEVDTLVGLSWDAPHWHIEGLHFKGVCSDDAACEHALHIVGDSDFGVIRHNIFEDFNAQIKCNGFLEDNVIRAPDDVLVEYNEFFDNAPRTGSNPVTKLNINSGSRWIVRGNFIHDFAKGGGNAISYAAFFKGKSRDGIFERNLVVCAMNHSGQVRVGLSLGGGGTGSQFCEDNDCSPEHRGGIIRNNIIANCSDVGIYLNQGADTLIEHNTLYATNGIDVRFEESSATLRHNILSSRIRERNGGTITSQENNLTQLSEADFANMFTNPGALDFGLLHGATFVDQAPSSTLTDDFCGATRTSPRDIGALEYSSSSPCATNRMPPVAMAMMMPGEDMGGGSSDMGGAREDMGGEQEDMGAPPAQDMSVTFEEMGSSGPGEDMAPRPGGPPDQGSTQDMGGVIADQGELPGTATPEEEGCTQARGPGAPASMASLLGLLGLLGLFGWRRRTSSDSTTR